MKVAIRVDASGEIGTGHLMRCLTLADALVERQSDVVFLCAPASAPWRGLIESHGHRYAELPLADGATSPVASALFHAGWLPWGQDADARAVREILPARVDWLIVDHYALDCHWERATRSCAERILAIDDLADRVHDCDVLLDQNPQASDRQRYDELAPRDAVRLIGPRYALLRPSFAAAGSQRKVRDGTVRRILVFMGGMDVAGACRLALAALSQPGLSDIAVDVMVGGNTPHRHDIEAIAGTRGKCRTHFDVADPAALFVSADLSIGAGGVAALERCSVGLPAITIAVAENQMSGLAALARAGAVRQLGALGFVDEHVLADAIRSLRETPLEIEAMSARARAITDGRGTARVVQALVQQQSGVLVRPATMDDGLLLHRWRDDAAVRAVSFDDKPIPYDDHRQWLARAIADPAHVVLVAMQKGEPVGSVRYRIDGDQATVSIVVAPELRGTGIGRKILMAGEVHLDAEHRGVARIVAFVKPGNPASERLFAGSGFALDFVEPTRMLYSRQIG